MFQVLVFIVLMTQSGFIVNCLPMRQYEGEQSDADAMSWTAPSNTNEGNNSSDNQYNIDKFMPRAEYRPQNQRKGESELHYQERLRVGNVTFQWRQKQLRKHLIEAAKRNTDPSTLKQEMEAALKDYKKEAKERRYQYPDNRELERGPFHHSSSTSTSRKEGMQRSVLPSDNTYDRKKRQRYASRLRRRFRLASEDKRKPIIEAAKEYGFTLDDLTREKFTPATFYTTILNARLIQAQEEIREENDHQHSYHPMESNALETEANYDDSCPQDWLTLSLPEHHYYE